MLRDFFLGDRPVLAATPLALPPLPSPQQRMPPQVDPQHRQQQAAGGADGGAAADQVVNAVNPMEALGHDEAPQRSYARVALARRKITPGEVKFVFDGVTNSTLANLRSRCESREQLAGLAVLFATENRNYRVTGGPAYTCPFILPNGQEVGIRSGGGPEHSSEAVTLKMISTWLVESRQTTNQHPSRVFKEATEFPASFGGPDRSQERKEQWIAGYNQKRQAALELVRDFMLRQTA